MRHSSLVSALIFLAIVLSLISAPAANSQNVTTITSLQTITTETVVTKFSVSTTQSTGYSTITTTQFATSSLAQPKRLLVYHENIRAPGEEYGCLFAHTTFAAQAGDVVKGTISSDNEINFYVMSQKDYDKWNSLGTCGVYVTTIVEEVVVGTYPIEFVIPANGRYQVVFLNFSHENDAKIDLSADIVGTAKESSVVVTRTYTQQSYSTQTAVVSTIVTRTATSLRTEQVGQVGFSMEGSSLLLMVAGIVVGLVVVGILFVLRGRQKKTAGGAVMYEPEAKAPPVAEPSPPPEPAAPVQLSRGPPPAMKFCVHCGATIPSIVMFCTKCGRKQ
jgi:hypothetical protein